MGYDQHPDCTTGHSQELIKGAAWEQTGQSQMIRGDKRTQRWREPMMVRPEESRSPGSKGGPITTDHGLWIWITDKC